MICCKSNNVFILIIFLAFQTLKQTNAPFSVRPPFIFFQDIGFTFSFVYTSTAKALLLISLNPLWCAVLGRFFLGDELPRRTVVELILALCCMMIIFLPDMIDRQSDDGSETDDTTWRGNIIALFTGTLLAVYISIVRKGGKSSKDIRLTGAAALGGALSAIISMIVRMGDVLPTAYWRGESRELWQYWCGAVAQGGGVGIFRITMSLAPKLLTGAEIGLALLLEAFFGPIWVFLAYGDVPSTWTIIGGSALLVILAVHESWPLLKNKLCANHHAKYEFIITEQELASHNNNPVIAENPIKLFDLQGLGVDLQQMVSEIGPTYEHLPWDLYLLKRDHVQYLAHCFPECHQALMVEFLPKYFAGVLHETDLAEHLERLGDEQLQAFKCIKPYRRRGISSFMLHKCEGCSNEWWRIEDLPHGAYAQSNTLVTNDYRSLERVFPPSPLAVTQNLQFRQVLVRLASMADKCRSGATKKIKITCQQVGITTDPDQIVSNSPEGIHQDGCDYIVSALVIERKGIAGGESVVFGPDKSTEYLRHTLQDGQGIFQADEGSPLWHIVEPIQPETMGQAISGVRNIIGYDIWVEE